MINLEAINPMQPVKITVKDGIGREAFNRPSPPINCGNSMIDKINEESYADNMIEYNRLNNECVGYPCPEIANTKPGETVEAVQIMQERLRGSNDDWVDCVVDGYDPICRTGYEQQIIYRLVPKEEKAEKTQLELLNDCFDQHIQANRERSSDQFDKYTYCAEILYLMKHEINKTIDLTPPTLK